MWEKRAAYSTEFKESFKSILNVSSIHSTLSQNTANASSPLWNIQTFEEGLILDAQDILTVMQLVSTVAPYLNYA